MFHIVLVHPEIPPNTGNIIRLAANTGCQLHLVEPLGFDLSAQQVRRAGLDYHEAARVKVHPDWARCQAEINAASPHAHWYALTTQGTLAPSAVAFKLGDVLVFGSETKGLPEPIRAQFDADQKLRLPMLATQRSLNLSNSVAIAVYEAWRQCGYEGC